MFKRIHPIANPVELTFEGRTISANEGESVAAALLAAGVTSFRQLTDEGAMRGPYCMIGNCYECRIEIDGRPNLQACQERVRDGMRVRVQRGMRGTGSGDGD
jgi:predicted molibdopterin-dependent oxidoreductase YjgC